MIVEEVRQGQKRKLDDSSCLIPLGNAMGGPIPSSFLSQGLKKRFLSLG